MKRLLILAVIAVAAALVWQKQHARQAVLAAHNARRAEVATQLRTRAERARVAVESAIQRASDLKLQLDAQEAAASSASAMPGSAPPIPPPPPDPNRYGGWPAGVDFLYLPKQHLTNASYRLLAGERLTAVAVALLGLSPAEQESANHAFGDLLGHYRQLEMEKMQPVDPPVEWGGGQFEFALTYRIPSLAPDLEAPRQDFSQRLQQSLGDTRRQLMEDAAEAHIREHTDDLGAGERVVGFLWQPERDGTHSLWYGIADAKHGGGSFQRVPDRIDGNSQMAYYARLFGVKLPGQP